MLFEAPTDYGMKVTFENRLQSDEIIVIMNDVIRKFGDQNDRTKKQV